MKYAIAFNPDLQEWEIWQREYMPDTDSYNRVILAEFKDINKAIAYRADLIGGYDV